MGSKSGIAKRTRDACPMTAPNYCVCHGSALPVKGAFKDIKALENFSTQTQDMLKMFKKSPQKEGYLENIKQSAQKDSLWDVSSHAGVLIEWCRHRWTENKKALQGMKNNLPYVKQTCKHFSDPKVKGDSKQRDRSYGHFERLGKFPFLFLIFLCMDFLEIIESMNKSFQRPTMTMSEVFSIAARTVEVLKKSRGETYWKNFYDACLRYIYIYI